MAAFAALARAFLTVFVVLGAGFAAVVLAVAGDRMVAQFAGAFRAVSGAITVDHESDSMGVVVRSREYDPYHQCRRMTSGLTRAAAIHEHQRQPEAHHRQ